MSMYYTTVEFKTGDFIEAVRAADEALENQNANVTIVYVNDEGLQAVVEVEGYEVFTDEGTNVTGQFGGLWIIHEPSLDVKYQFIGIPK